MAHSGLSPATPTLRWMPRRPAFPRCSGRDVLDLVQFCISAQEITLEW